MYMMEKTLNHIQDKWFHSKTSDEVIALLKMTAKKYGQTIVMITHDDEIAQVADRILVIEDGQVVDFR